MTDWYWEAATTHSQQDYADRDGSLAKPWVLCPLRLGINPGAMDPSVFQPGDTLWVLDSHEWGSFDSYFLATGISGLTIRGDFPGRPGDITSVRLVDCTGVTVQDCRMRQVFFDGGGGHTLDRLVVNFGDKGFDTNRDKDTDDIIIRDCRIHDQDRQGIAVFSQPTTTRDNWLITGNHIYNVGLNRTVPDGDCEGIGLQRMTNSVITRNHIHHCDYGINLWEGGNGISHDVTISYNDIHHISSNYSSWPGRGILISGGSVVAGSIYNIAVEYNRVRGTDKEGIRLQSPTPNEIGLVCRNNQVTDVNRVFGTRNTEFIIAPTPWAVSGNITHAGSSSRQRIRRR